MDDSDLIWKEVSRKTVFKTRVFSIGEIESAAPATAGGAAGKAKTGSFSVIESNDWAMIIPLFEGAGGKEFIMVRQWRHGAGEVSVEFPGGVIEKGEDILSGAGRELLEETGYKAEKWTFLASMSPNPAIMSNKMHFFLAEDLSPPARQNLDKDEFIRIERHSVREVFENLGKPPYIHSLIAAALAFYERSAA